MGIVKRFEELLKSMGLLIHGVKRLSGNSVTQGRYCFFASYNKLPVFFFLNIARVIINLSFIARVEMPLA